MSGDVRIEIEINSLRPSCGTTGERVERSVPYPPSFLGVDGKNIFIAE
jgi:hypothetical protein